MRLILETEESKTEEGFKLPIFNNWFIAEAIENVLPEI